MDNAHFLRGMLLFDQGRHDLAEPELRQALAVDPGRALAHAYLALCLSEREEFAEATREAEAAVGLAADESFVHYAYARVMYRRRHYAPAEAAVREAIRLNPDVAGYFALLAGIHLDQEQWREALAAAEQGLEHDPEHAGCNNLRAMALVKLGRRDEAGATLAETLARDPENAYSHANLGWALLHQGDRVKAMEHFREALRLDPELDWARAGIVEAMKAKNFIYRWLLAYFLWMSRLSGQSRWMLVIGLYVGFRVLSSLKDRNPELSPVLAPLIILYIAWAILTWLGPSVFNLLLRLDHFGRLALSREQVVASNWIAGLLLLGLAALAGYLATDFPPWLLTAMALGFLSIPMAATFNCPRGWPRRLMAAVTAVLACLGASIWWLWGLAELGVIHPRQIFDIFDVTWWAFLIGVLVSSFLANYLAQIRVRR